MKKRGTLVVRANGEEVRKISAYLSVEIAEELAAYCFQFGKDISEVVGEALIDKFKSKDS